MLKRCGREWSLEVLRQGRCTQGGQDAHKLRASPPWEKPICLGVRGLNLGHSISASWRRCPETDLEGWVVTIQGVRVPVGRLLRAPGS